MILSDVISPIVPIAPVVPLTEVTDKQLALYADSDLPANGDPRRSAEEDALVEPRAAAIAGDGHRGIRRVLRAPQTAARRRSGMGRSSCRKSPPMRRYLFRDENHWEWFRGSYLPQCAAEARVGSRPLLACESGRPPAARATKRSPPPAASPPACPTSSSGRSASSARTSGSGRWRKPRPPGSRSARCGSCRRRTRGGSSAKDAQANLWQARPVLTGMAAFRQHNLLDPLRERPFDVVFLKNVLIYFAAASKKTSRRERAFADPARGPAGGGPRRRDRRPAQGLRASATLVVPTAQK